MKTFFCYIAYLLLFFFSTQAGADKVDQKNSIDSRYAYSMGFWIGQSLTTQDNTQPDLIRIREGLQDSLQGKQPVSGPEVAGAETKSALHDDYHTGYRIGQMMITQGINKSAADSMIEGIDDSLHGNKPRLDETEMNDAPFTFRAYKKALRKNDAKANMADAEAYLEKNRKREGIVVTASGLQYEIINPAQGIQPKPDSTVLVHYHGTFIDGEVFDSSLSRKQPEKLQLDKTIPGFTEALTRMHTGEKWRIVVPPALGYGVHGVKGSIGPNELLIFEIELLQILD